MTVRCSYWFFTLLLLAPAPAFAEVVEDWGAVITPIESETTFSFEQYDITDNFTHDYLFTLEGEAGATYEVTFEFDTCNHGCGNPDLSYGIYDQNGGLYLTESGTVLLSAGTYSFQVSGTGMGAGNSADYWGDVTFTATAVTAESIVAPVPEPTTLALTAVGGWIVGFAAYRRRRSRPAAAEPAAPLPGVP